MLRRSRPIARLVLAGGLWAVAAAGVDAAEPLPLALPASGVAVAVPPWCATREGPGTLEAVCDPEGESDRSREAQANAALYLEVSVADAPEDRGLAADAALARHPIAAFTSELPDAVCGQARDKRMKIEAAALAPGATAPGATSPGATSQGATAAGATAAGYEARVTCPPVRFLSLRPREARVRTYLSDGRRIRLLARAPADDFARLVPDIDAFFASLKIDPRRAP